MLRIYETDCAALAPYWDKALALLPPERRQRVQLCRDRAAALGIAAGGLRLRAVHSRHCLQPWQGDSVGAHHRQSLGRA